MNLRSLNSDTIAALATAPGRGGIGVIRISGPQTCFIAEKILGHLPPVRFAHYGSFYDSENLAIDKGIALYFKGPHSFTGEDVLELQGHGGPVVLELLLKRCCELGARMAIAGEFSLRAFLNNKIDLVQAEALVDLINATTVQEARSALRSLDGDFSASINHLLEELIALRMYVEASLDFPDEEVELLHEGSVLKRLNRLQEQLLKISKAALQGRLLLEGMKTVIVGRPNAGKSSLLNRLSGYEAAIVTDIPGTTRDVLRESMMIGALKMQMVDTAGLRETTDVIEREGVRRAKKEWLTADHLLLVVDATTGTDKSIEELFPEWCAFFPPKVAITLVYNKIDKLSIEPKVVVTASCTQIYVSAKTGDGLDLLKKHLQESSGLNLNHVDGCIARARHVEALVRTAQSIEEALLVWKSHNSTELLAEELKEAQASLSEITGVFRSDDLLGKIFSEFCIGK